MRQFTVSMMFAALMVLGGAVQAQGASGIDFSQCDGLSGPALGLCKAGTAIGCLADNTGDPACIHITETYATITGEQAPWTAPCPCASLDGWDDDISTRICDVGGNWGVLEGISDDFWIILTTVHLGGEFRCSVSNSPTFIDEVEFEACKGSLLQIAGNDDVECTDFCGPGEVPPC